MANDITLATYSVAREAHKRGKFKVFDVPFGTMVEACIGEMHFLFGDVDSARTFAYGILTAINDAKVATA